MQCLAKLSLLLSSPLSTPITAVSSLQTLFLSSKICSFFLFYCFHNLPPSLFLQTDMGVLPAFFSHPNIPFSHIASPLHTTPPIFLFLRHLLSCLPYFYHPLYHPVFSPILFPSALIHFLSWRLPWFQLTGYSPPPPLFSLHQ